MGGMTRPRHPVPTALLLAGLVVGCAGDGGEAGAPATEPTPSATSEEPTVPGSSPDPSTGLDAQVEVALDKLAARLDVPAEEIEVVSAEAVTWGDTSLGCPQPGMRYAQVVTDGVLIVLAHDGVEYPFHAGGDRPDPFLCEQAPDKGPTPSPLDPR